MLTVAVPKRNKLPNIIVLTPKDGRRFVLSVSISENLRREESRNKILKNITGK